MNDPTLELHYTHAEKVGYGRMGVKFSECLSAEGVKIAPVSSRGDREAANTIMWMAPPPNVRGWMKDQYRICFTMWEAQTLPESYRDNLHNLDMLIVPSQQNLELFSNYHPNVKYVPLGFDSHDWTFRERTMPAHEFIFLIGGSGTRKGVDIAYKAFLKNWAEDGSWPTFMPRPTLIFKSPKGSDFYHSRIRTISGHIPPEKERDLYAMAHCYLQPSRGEGWGLQPLQAIAQGCPTILTDAHGHKAFSHLGWGLDTTNSKAAYFSAGDAGDWWEPDVNQLAKSMMDIYMNYGQAVEKARNFSALAHSNFTWEIATKKLLEAIGDQIHKPYSGNFEWIEPRYMLFPIVTKRDHTCMVANTIYQFKGGHLTYENSDVKRILSEADELDPVCLSDNPGILPDVIDLEQRLSSTGYCYACHQPLNQKLNYDDSE